jgi:hypothetical protein
MEARKLQFLIKKIKIKFPAVNFFQFRSSKPGSGSGIRIRNPGSGFGIRDPESGIRIRNPGSGSGIRDPDPESGFAIEKNAGSESVSGSALNQSGSATLPGGYGILLQFLLAKNGVYLSPL